MAIAPTRTLKVVGADEAVTPTLVEPVRLVNPDGSDYAPSGSGTAYVLPAATQNALGGVKLQVFGEAIGNARPSGASKPANAASNASTS